MCQKLPWHYVRFCLSLSKKDGSGQVPWRGLARCAPVILRIDHQTPLWSLAFAFGVEIGFVSQCKVHDAALARRHRAEVIWSPGLADFVGGDIGRGTQFLNAHRAPVLAIEADLLVFAGCETQHLQSDQFKSPQQFCATIEQHGGVRAGEVDEDFGFLPVAVLRQWRVNDDAVFEAKTTVRDDGLEKLIDFIRGGYFVHKSFQLSAVSYQLTAQRDSNVVALETVAI